MATDDDKEKEGKEQEGEAQPPKSKKKLIIIIAAVVVVIVLGLTAFLLLGGKEQTEGEDAQYEEAERELAHVELKPFIVNLSSSTSYLKVVLVLEYDPVVVAGGHAEKAAEGGGGGHGGGGDSGPALPGVLGEREAMINDAIIKVLSSKSVETVLSLDGKEQIKEELIEAINDASGLDEAPVANVYFQDFIIQ